MYKGGMLRPISDSLEFDSDMILMEFTTSGADYIEPSPEPNPDWTYWIRLYHSPRIATKGRLPTLQEMREHAVAMFDGWTEEKWSEVIHRELVEWLEHENDQSLRLWGPDGEDEPDTLGTDDDGWTPEILEKAVAERLAFLATVPNDPMRRPLGDYVSLEFDEASGTYSTTLTIPPMETTGRPPTNREFHDHIRLCFSVCDDAWNRMILEKLGRDEN